MFVVAPRGSRSSACVGSSSGPDGNLAPSWGCSAAGAARGLQNRLRGADDASWVGSIPIHPRQLRPPNGSSLGLVACNRGADQLLQRRLVNGIALRQVDRTRSLGLESPVEEMVRIRQARALEEVDFDVVFESADGADVPIGAPDRDVPLPFLFEAGVSGVDDLAQPRHPFAAPVGEPGDVLVDAGGRFLAHSTSSLTCQSGANGAVRGLYHD